MDDILSCPFCGGDPRLGLGPDDTNYVFCHDCHCETPRTDDRDKAIAAWNKRHHPKQADLESAATAHAEAQSNSEFQQWLIRNAFIAGAGWRRGQGEDGK